MTTQSALDVMTDGGLTDAEVAAIKIHTADDFRYLNPALAGDRGRWLTSQIAAIDGPRTKDNRVMGDKLEPGMFGPLSPADTAVEEGVRHGTIAVDGLKKLPPWKGDAFRGIGLTP